MRRFSIALGVLLFLCSRGASAQEAQFIHASPYNESRYVDVYLDGEIWRKDFDFGNGTPIEPWRSRTLLEVRYHNASPRSVPLIRETVVLAPGSMTALVLGGDPLARDGNPGIELFRVENIHKEGTLPTFNELRTIWLAHGFDGMVTLRDWEVEPAIDARIFNAPQGGYQVFTYGSVSLGALPVAPFRHEVDHRRPDGSLLGSTMIDLTGVQGIAWVIATTDGAPWTGNSWENVYINWDGQALDFLENAAPLQFVNNSPYREAESLRIRVTRIDSLGPDPIELELEDLRFRTATPFMMLPSGVYAGRRRSTAPDLLVEVFADAVSPEDSSATIPHLTTRIRLHYGDDHVAVLSGDPLERDGQPPMSLDLIGEWWATMAEASGASAAPPGTTLVAFSHGIADMTAADLYRGDETNAVFGFVPIGGSAQRDYLIRDDTLRLARSGTAREIASFPTGFASAARGDSTFVLVSSGFRNSPPPTASSDATLGMFLVPRGGGDLQPLEKLNPPAVWTYWWFWAALLGGLAVFGLGFNQVRVVRLRSRQEELGRLVDERTHALTLEKNKTEEQALRLTELDEAKNRFFTNISHEFRTPLTLILGPIQDVLESGSGQSLTIARDRVLVMRRSALRVLRLINQLLDLSKLKSGGMTIHPRTSDLASFTAGLGRSFVPLAERGGLDLTISIPDDPVAFSFDGDAIEKAVSNLISNAIKFTPPGGKVLVELKDADGSVQIAIRDTGPGIPASDLKRVFERFQQADTSIRRKFGGSGVGLTLARELVELHGGTLSVASQVGYGTTFTITLQRSSAPIQQNGAEETQPGSAALLEHAILDQPAAEVEAEADDAHGALVLIVDDNADVRIYLQESLKERYQIREAADGEQALALARDLKPDLVMTDVMMPRMDGYELCQHIKDDSELQHIPVILLTAKASETDTIEGLRCRADAYISKPFSMPALHLRIANLIASRRTMREQFSGEVIVKPTDIPITSEDEVFLANVLERIEVHLGDANYSVDWLADDLSMSPRHLQRRVHTVVGLTPAQLVRRMRMERASQLLRAHAGTVSDTAYAVGFRSPSHFAQVFRRAYGESPTEHAEASADEAQV